MLKILIVDDEIKIREVVREYAEASGYKSDEQAMATKRLKKLKTMTMIALF